jgi:hypothetical protein
MELKSERWGQIVDEALLAFPITTDNLTPPDLLAAIGSKVFQVVQIPVPSAGLFVLLEV